jgi:hypothetical protein
MPDQGRAEVTAADYADAVRRVRSFYPEDIFPWPTESLEGKAAFMARLTCDNVEREAHRIARERANA